MKKTLTFIISIILLGIAYSQPKIQYKNGKWVVDKKILFSEFSKQFNHLRDSFNLPHLSFGKIADTIAWEHSKYMAETGDYQHGMRTMDYSEKLDYILGEKTKYDVIVSTAENLLKLDGYQFSDEFLKTVDRKSLEKSGGKGFACLFFRDDIKYSDLAKDIISDWMKSPEHRETLLSEKYKYFSIAVVSDSKNCLYITYECRNVDY